MHRVRHYIVSRVGTGWHWAALEAVIRAIENRWWPLWGKEIVECFGDSHAKVLRRLNRSPLNEQCYFRVVSVRGATVSGLNNPNSKTNALRIFSRYVAEARPHSTLVFLLGEVDCGFLIWLKASQNGMDPCVFMEQTVERYQRFVTDMVAMHGSGKVLIISAPLPTIPDEGASGAIAKVRSGIKTSQVERTKLTLQFNRRMELWASSQGFGFLDLDSVSLDQKTKLVKTSLLNKNASDHHYDDEAYTDTLVTQIMATGVEKLCEE